MKNCFPSRDFNIWLGRWRSIQNTLLARNDEKKNISQEIIFIWQGEEEYMFPNLVITYMWSGLLTVEFKFLPNPNCAVRQL